MEMLSHARVLHQGFEDLIKKTEKIEKMSRGESKAEIQDLKRDLMKGKEETSKMIKTGETDCQEIKKMQEKIGALEKEVADLKSKLEESQKRHVETKKRLDKMEGVLHTGQLIYNFEKDLATYIYPRGHPIGSKRIFTKMKKWLDENKESEAGKISNEKWNKLKEEFSWSDDHDKIFLDSIKSRLQYAHPIVDEEFVKSYTDENFTDARLSQCIRDIIKINERVNDLIV